ncbi:glucosamine-6-phosphate deaminase [Fibrella aestuarina BUZ 2]|uniref:Glucosamine-6-phosphate deaminase n=1 Tax=Fibrella aestuarina BUZ 2 TaxID=1166018 RepID=I0K7I4_9BACT|nr:glucosamine-6-phosphate deaminase [Fibrella aestuarina]CCH00087.1 glucosamine-6-phosphate deaminase [Fibrella aestuarina BUZ 2]
MTYSQPSLATATAPVTLSFERVPLQLYPTADLASKAVAQEIADLIVSHQRTGDWTVLGLATGSSPKKVYAELIRLHREEGLSFRRVITFNLDEYYPIQPDALQSYHRFMHEHLFDHVDISPENIHIPTGTLPADDLKAYCADYEQKIQDVGGLDFQLLGIGRNGHIGFNEPGSHQQSTTRLITLDFLTRADAAAEFGGLAQVPKRAITMGIRTILAAKRIVLLAWGEHKATILQRAVEGPVSELLPASYLQTHPNATIIVDEAGASELTIQKTPWLFDAVTWTPTLIKKAVTQLALSLNKPVLKLTNSDYNEHGLSDLLAQHGRAYDINILVFNWLQHTITGWPGGKPNADDTNRPERSQPARKRVLLFSPHPDDDIISMGGTFQRLVDQGHEVHVAYQTSGNIAVADDEALRFLEFVVDFKQQFGIEATAIDTLFSEAKRALETKKASEQDPDAVRKVKGLIRRGEAKNTCRFVGIPTENAHFLSLPFYETGRIEKNPIGADDIRLIADLIARIRPHQLYAAGDLADPHGTHKVCLDGIFAALQQLKHETYMQDCWVWLYRGAWAEWGIHEIEMAVPMSPEQVLQKRYGIFKHQSQKDGVVFQGNDAREFWQRAEDRNRDTAALYNQLGLADYAAMEAFVRYHFL